MCVGPQETKTLQQTSSFRITGGNLDQVLNSQKKRQTDFVISASLEEARYSGPRKIRIRTFQVIPPNYAGLFAL